MKIFTDLEYLYPGMTKESGRPDKTKKRQIIQIAAIKVDDNGKEVETFDQLILPTYTQQLPEFFIELTGITQKDVDKKAIPLADGLEKFLKFVEGHEIWTMHKDYEVWQQNCSYINKEFPLPPFIVVKDKLAGWGVDPDKYTSGTLYKAVGLEMDGHIHNALHDVRSMSAAIYILDK